MKKCSKCKENKDLSEFYSNKSRKNGKSPQCKKCCKEYERKNKDKIRARKQKYHENNKEKINSKTRQWNKKNKKWCREYRRQYRADNPHNNSNRCARRRANKIRATLPGFEKDIEEVYRLCKDLQWLSEELLVVDHIIPLSNKKVCGLHVPWNLQIITETKNLQKKNKFDGTYNNASH